MEIGWNGSTETRDGNNKKDPHAEFQTAPPKNSKILMDPGCSWIQS